MNYESTFRKLCMDARKRQSKNRTEGSVHRNILKHWVCSWLGLYRQPLDSSDCPICYEAFEEAQIEKILFCKTCGNNVHAVIGENIDWLLTFLLLTVVQECFDRWVAYNRQETRCVYCRSVWEAEKKTTAKGKNRVSRPEGYANFAAAAGLPQERGKISDDSSLMERY